VCVCVCVCLPSRDCTHVALVLAAKLMRCVQSSLVYLCIQLMHKYDHITPTLCDTLYRLPMSQRITFKVVLMTYDCIRGRSQVYFHDICSPIVSVPFRSRLRSADNDDMIIPRTRPVHYGRRSFHITAHQILNMLPPHLKDSNVSREQFKLGLKTWLFVQAYS